MNHVKMEFIKWITARFYCTFSLTYIQITVHTNDIIQLKSMVI